jgi:hypothetical protein
VVWYCNQKSPIRKGKKMETVGLFVVAMMILAAVALVLLVATTKGWRKAIPGAGATMLILGATVLVALMMLSSRAPNVSPALDFAEKDFCQVVWEEKTNEGKVIVIIKNSAGNLLFSEFDEPLGAKKILVVEKGRFQSFPPVEKPAPVPPKQ